MLLLAISMERIARNCRSFSRKTSRSVGSIARDEFLNGNKNFLISYWEEGH